MTHMRRVDNARQLSHKKNDAYGTNIFYSPKNFLALFNKYQAPIANPEARPKADIYIQTLGLKICAVV